MNLKMNLPAPVGVLLKQRGAKVLRCGPNHTDIQNRFDRLYELYSDNVLYQIKRIVQDNDAADDLLQDVFVRAWAKREDLDDIVSHKSWLIRIGINLSLNYLRGQNRKRELLFTEYSDSDDENGYALQKALADFATPGPDTQLERKTQAELIRKLIDELPQDKRSVLEMFIQQDYGVREISKKLGIPQGTVKSRLHYGRKTLSGRIRDILSD